MTNLIARTLQEDPVSLTIVRFLLKNKQAMDSVKGIAAWWVGCDEVAVQVALDRLTACGVVSAHTFKSCTLYTLSPNVDLCRWLETWLDDHQPQSKNNRASFQMNATQPAVGPTTVPPTSDLSSQ